MAAEYRHAHACAAYLQLGAVQYLPPLVLQLHLLARVAHEGLGAYLRYHVVCYLVRENAWLNGLARAYCRRFLAQFAYALRARAAHRLIG